MDQLPRVRELDAAEEEQHHRRGRQSLEGSGKGQAEQACRRQAAQGRQGSGAGVVLQAGEPGGQEVSPAAAV